MSCKSSLQSMSLVKPKWITVLAGVFTISTVFGFSYNTANADDNLPGFYLAPWVGTANYSDFGSQCQDVVDSLSFIGNTAAPNVSIDCSVDNTDAALGVAIGWRVNQNLAFELGYHDLGSLNTDVRTSSSFESNDTSDRVDVSGLSLSAILGLPIGQNGWLYGRLGIFNADAEGSVSVRNPNTGQLLFANVTEDETEAYVGVGYQHNFFSHLGGRIEFNKFDLGQDVDLISAGAVIKF